MKRQSDDHKFDRLDSAVQAVLSEPVPYDAVERVKEQASQLGTPAATYAASTTQTAAWYFRWASYGGLAAAVMLISALAISSLLLDGISVRAFAEVVQNAVQARSVQATVIHRLGKRPEKVVKLYMEENKIRVEEFGQQLVIIGDLESRNALYLSPEKKLVQKRSIDERIAKIFANPVDQLRTIKAENADYVGEEYLDKTLAQVYRIKRDVLGIKRSKSHMIVWVDPESGLPMKIVNHDFNEVVQQEIRFEDFVWNQPLAPALFSLEIPAGYELGNVVYIPPPTSSREPASPTRVDPSALAEGLLSNDRVPRRIVWGPDGATLTATMCDPETVSQLQQKRDELRQWDVATGKLNWHVVGCNSFSLATSHDGKMLATINDHDLQLRDPKTGKVTKKWATDKRLSPLAFSPNGNTLAAGISEWSQQHGGEGEQEGGVQLWDIERGVVVKTFLDDRPSSFLRFSKDGKLLANAPNGGSIKVWDVSSGQLARILPYGGKFDFSPDSRFIACMASQPLPGDTPADVKKRYDVQVYELQTGKLIKTLVSDDHTEESWVLWIEFSPDGKSVAVANWDGTIKLWDFSSGELLTTITEQEGGTHSAVFAPEGNTIATGSEDKTLRLWKLDEITSGP